MIKSRDILLPKNKKLKKWYWWYKIKKNSKFVISIFNFMQEQFSHADYTTSEVFPTLRWLCLDVTSSYVSQSWATVSASQMRHYLSISLCLTECTCVLWSIVPWCVNIFCPHFPCTHTPNDVTHLIPLVGP